MLGLSCVFSAAARARLARSLVAGGLLVGCGDDAASGGAGTVGATASTSTGDCTARAFRAQAWPEADALFRQEPRWLGSDAAYSIALSPGRVLWLFGDSFIATTPARLRTESTLVRNSIGIQSGTDPTVSTMRFHWREIDGTPASFFPEAGEHWFWPLHGARVGDRLVIFLGEIQRVDGGLGFRSVGARIVTIDNPDASPELWTLTTRVLPDDDRAHGVSVVVEDGFLYAFSNLSGDIGLERWPTADLDGPSAIWNGDAFVRDAAAASVWTQGAPEFVTARHGCGYLTIESRGFGATDLVVRRAPSLTGPWTAPEFLFRPEESDRPEAFVYAGKLQPTMTGADVVATYAANSFDFAELLADPSLYYPRFVRIDALP